MNIDIMDLKLTWSYLWSVILKYSSWALIDKVLQFVFEFDRSIDEKKFDFLIFLIFWSCNTVIEIGLISVLNYISEVDTDKPTKSKLEFEVIPKSFWPIVFPLEVENLSFDSKLRIQFWDLATLIIPPIVSSQVQRPQMTCRIYSKIQLVNEN